LVLSWRLPYSRMGKGSELLALCSAAKFLLQHEKTLQVCVSPTTPSHDSFFFTFVPPFVPPIRPLTQSPRSKFNAHVETGPLSVQRLRCRLQPFDGVAISTPRLYRIPWVAAIATP
jgi:hypothetical protein